MGELSIKISIANRSYPLSIQRHEEEGIRKAAKLIEKNIKDLQENYAVKDDQDVLAMTALQYATQVVEGKVDTVEDESVIEDIQRIDKKLEDYLNSVWKFFT